MFRKERTAPGNLEAALYTNTKGHGKIVPAHGPTTIDDEQGRKPQKRTSPDLNGERQKGNIPPKGTSDTMNTTNTVLRGGGFHHVAIRARDFDASVRFYTNGLGFKEKIAWGEGAGRAIMLDTGDGNYLEIFAGGTNEPKPEGTILHFALRTGNCDDATQRAVAAGATVTMPPKDIDIPSRPGPTPVRISFVKGPDGEIIEFFQNELT